MYRLYRTAGVIWDSKDAWLAQLNLQCMVSLSAINNKGRATRHFRIPWLEQRRFLKVCSKCICWFILSDTWNLLKVDASLESCHKSASPLSFFFFSRNSESTKVLFWPGCLLQQISLMFGWQYRTVWGWQGVPGPSTDKLSPTPKDEGRWIQTTQAHHPACSQHLKGTHYTAWPACLSVAADLSQSYTCLSLHPPHLLCWHCSLMPIYKDDVRSVCVCVCVCMHMGPGLCWWFSVSLIF